MSRARPFVLSGLAAWPGLLVCCSEGHESRPVTEKGADSALAPVGGCDGRGAAFTLPATAVAEDAGLTVVLTSADPPVARLGDNEWTLRIEDRDGLAAAGRSPSVVPWMPDHGHGAPKTVTVRDLGDGLYEAGPINLNMPGLWEIRVSLAVDGGAAARAVFSFCVRDR